MTVFQCRRPSSVDSQLEKHILHRCPEVAVLSAFPLFVLDYFGVEKLISMLR